MAVFEMSCIVYIRSLLTGQEEHGKPTFCTMRQNHVFAVESQQSEAEQLDYDTNNHHLIVILGKNPNVVGI